MSLRSIARSSLAALWLAATVGFGPAAAETPAEFIERLGHDAISALQNPDLTTDQRSDPALSPPAGRLGRGRFSRPLHPLRSVRRGLPQPLHQVFRPGKWPALTRYALHRPARAGLHSVHEMRGCLPDRSHPAHRTRP